MDDDVFLQERVMSNVTEVSCEYIEPNWAVTLYRRIVARFKPKEESNYLKHAKLEFFALGYVPLDTLQEDGPNKWIQENIMELLAVFSKQGHSGSSAPYCISMFEKLARFEPIAPLSGMPWEWHEVSDGVFQNKRCSHVFKDKTRFDGQAYDIDAVIFRETNGSCYTNRDSFRPVVFPYTPKREYIDRPTQQP